MVVCFPGLEEVRYEEFQRPTGELLPDPDSSSVEQKVFLAAPVPHSLSNVSQSRSNGLQASLCCLIPSRVVQGDSFGVFGALAAAVGITHQFTPKKKLKD